VSDFPSYSTNNQTRKLTPTTPTWGETNGNGSRLGGASRAWYESTLTIVILAHRVRIPPYHAGQYAGSRSSREMTGSRPVAGGGAHVLPGKVRPIRQRFKGYGGFVPGCTPEHRRSGVKDRPPTREATLEEGIVLIVPPGWCRGWEGWGRGDGERGDGEWSLRENRVVDRSRGTRRGSRPAPGRQGLGL